MNKHRGQWPPAPPRLTVRQAVATVGADEVYAPNGQGPVYLDPGALNDPPEPEDDYPVGPAYQVDNGPDNCGYHYGYCEDEHPMLFAPRCVNHRDEDAVKPRSDDPRSVLPLCAECRSAARQGI